MHVGVMVIFSRFDGSILTTQSPSPSLPGCRIEANLINLNKKNKNVLSFVVLAENSVY